MATIGDLFIRVTAKDQNFHRSMSKVQRSVRNVTGSVAKMAGTFGATLGTGAMLAGVMKAVSTYSGEFAAAMARVQVAMTQFWIVVGKHLGPVFAQLVDDARKFFEQFVGMDAIVSVLQLITEAAQVMRFTFGSLPSDLANAFQLISKIIAKVSPFIRFMEMVNTRNRNALSKGINPEQLAVMQADGTAADSRFGGNLINSIPGAGSTAAADRIVLELRTLGKIMVRKLGGFF